MSRSRSGRAQGPRRPDPLDVVVRLHPLQQIGIAAFTARGPFVEGVRVEDVVSMIVCAALLHPEPMLQQLQKVKNAVDDLGLDAGMVMVSRLLEKYDPQPEVAEPELEEVTP